MSWVEPGTNNAAIMGLIATNRLQCDNVKHVDGVKF